VLAGTLNPAQSINQSINQSIKARYFSRSTRGDYCVDCYVYSAVGWSVPWLSVLAIVVLSIASVILYLVPLRYLALAWGVNKFTKKLRAPNAIDNNELLDYLSRVPSDRELVRSTF